MARYTADQTEMVKRTYKAIAAAPTNKRTFAEALAEAFMNGMETQEQIHANIQRAAIQSQMVRPSP